LFSFFDDFAYFSCHFFYLPSGRAGLVTATQLRPALYHQPIPKIFTFGPALVKAAYAATV